MVVGSVVGQLGIVTGGSLVTGGVIGFVAKKLVKLVVAVIGAQLALFAYLDHKGYLDVHWQAVDGALAAAGRHVGALPEWLTTLGMAVPIGVGFVGGFLVGFKRA
jgi:uncharacterized membrane protein (Fun14 family)